MALSALNKVFSSTSAKHLSGTTLIIIQKEDKMVKNIIKNLHLRDAMKAFRPAVPAEMADRHFGLVIRSPHLTLKCKGINDSASVNAVTEGLGLDNYLARQHVHEESLARIKATSPLGYATSVGVAAIALGVGTCI